MLAPAPTDQLQQSDRRGANRFQPAFGTTCRLDLRPQTREMGLVRDLSRTGVSMFVTQPPIVGSVIRGELTTETGETPVSVSLNVVHVRLIATGDYLVGAKFTRPLRPEEVRRFVTSRPSAPFDRPDSPQARGTAELSGETR